ncbi:duf323 domain-containing protein [Moniliophthora roreri MCA 2997]|uniref:Duf323 domain-containing protein n=1 Tax=Moniliophthora roreri (strain MCA 2997) TaxID=1381753 RepID=V2XLG5_MONRO|nr:duf323 domain-containing protein [Moniliophthora roreri MCA 2997]
MVSIFSVVLDPSSLGAIQHSFSSSSPVSESETGSEHSCSSSSSNTVDAENFPLPQSYVQLNPKLLNADLIKDLYESHAQDGLLGLCLTESRISEGTHWSAKRWNQYEYLLSTAPQGNFPIQAPRDDADILLIFSVALLRPIIAFAYQDGSSLYILERPPIAFSPTSLTSCYNPPSQPSNATLEPENAVGNIPSLEEWSRLWTIWDLVTLKMIPQEMLHQKPIDLRHKCLFYIGHIPTFLDMLLSRAIGGEATEPKYFWNIFERGIDPHVDDPDHCHNHSEVPERDEDWPSLETIITFRDGVRARLARLYDELNTGKRRLTRNIARTLVMTHEHEGFHVETLLYMLIQRGGTGTLPPLGFTIPPWTALAEQFNQIPPPSTPYATVGPAEIVLGHQDSEGDDDGELKFEVQDHEYGWDNESPPRSVSVGAFRAEWRPVTNAEFEVFWRDCQGKVPMPESWVEEDGELQVRTLYGPVPMHVAQHWPVLTSYDDLAAYAQSKGGRLPTEPELRLFLDTYDVGFEGGASLGFRHWHPVPATAGLDANEGRGSNGAVWEWTSTVFDGHEGLVPTKLFTGYSTDFFDTKHQVVLGASYATIPRLARRTVRNFYQHNYPYPWVSARVVYDL